MNEQPVLYTVAAGVAEICFNRPAARNALDIPTADALLAAIVDIRSRDDVRVVVLKGAGGAFVAGGDLAAMRDAGDEVSEMATRLVGTMHEAMLGLAACPAPVIASLSGPVAGAGMSLALAADLVIAADNTVFNMAYVNVANNSDCGASWYLTRVVGLHKAMEIMMLSDVINAQQARDYGIVNKLVPVDDLAAETAAMAARLIAKAPLALANIKKLLLQSTTLDLATQLDAEQEHFVTLTRSEDFKEALAAFFAKRKPEFRGR